MAPGTGPADYARACAECRVRGEMAPPSPGGAIFTERAACFVSIKKAGQLRGCIGTLTAAEPDLAAEIAHNAGSAAFHDPRFAPVDRGELEQLSYSVDVLGEPEDVGAMSDLDERKYGIIVRCGARRGVLLPDLAGVDSVAKQVSIALQKAGIAAHEPFEIQRFTVTRYSEEPRADAG